MANLFDYLEWRGDVPLSLDPFGEVDNLLLAELAYTDFCGVVPEDGTEISVGEALRGFFSRHTREEVLADKKFTAKAPLLMEGMAQGARFRDMKLCWYLNEIDQDREEQLSAVTFLLPDGSAYVAFRGTDDTLVGWKEDFNFSYLSETAGQRRAVEYLNQAGKRLSGPILVGGHSKGGNFAVYASAFCEEDVQARIQTIYSNDGPGFRQEIVDSEAYGRVLPRIVSIVPDSAVVGLLLSRKSVPQVIKSSAWGIFQHDGFTWQVKRSRFVAAPLSVLGEMTDKVLGGWLEQLDDETRRVFTRTIFSILEATGAETLSDIGEQKWKGVEAIFAAIRALPREKQQQILRILGQLGQSGGQVTAEYLAALRARKAGEDQAAGISGLSEALRDLNPMEKIRKIAEKLLTEKE